MSLTFTCHLKKDDELNATGIVVPEEVISELAAGKKPPVTVAINGYTYASTVAVMGGQYMLPLAKVHREAIGVKAGDSFEVTLTLDSAPRVYEVPEALAAAMDAAPGTRAKFDALAPSKRKEIARQVNDAKTDETRERRIAKVIEQLAA